MMRADVEDVTKARSRSLCVHCDRKPAVGTRRSKVILGSGRSSVSFVLCQSCGGYLVEMIRDEADMAHRYMIGEATSIRHPDRIIDEWVKKVRRLAAERKAAREARPEGAR
jgi:hypothetical protein